MMDVAFSGNSRTDGGAAGIPAAVEIIVATMHRFNLLLPATRLRLIITAACCAPAGDPGIRSVKARWMARSGSRSENAAQPGTDRIGVDRQAPLRDAAPTHRAEPAGFAPERSHADAEKVPASNCARSPKQRACLATDTRP